ncbi:MAG TPA: cyclase family protein [Bryobacteraceae bacterium]|nr:cyclase family protein [Bryobacteraceae bacterium]
MFSPLEIDSAKIVDLTYSLDEKTVHWPDEPAFQHERLFWGATPEGYFYASGRFATAEHVGTHMDGPIHFAEGQFPVDEVPVSQLIGPAVVVDVSASCASDANFRVTVADLSAWENTHGAIPAGAMVLFHTGWGRYWGDAKKYLGLSDQNPSQMHFPGIGAEAASALAGRHPRLVGIDTASIDYGQSQDYPVHRIVCPAGICALENIAHLELLPATGAILIALPIKIRGGSGAPARVIAILP